MPTITISLKNELFEKLNDPLLKKSALVNLALEHYFKRDVRKDLLWNKLMRDLYLESGLTEEQKEKVLEIATWAKAEF